MTDPSTAHPETLPDSRPTWSLFERVAFRYLFCHWLLYAFPRPITEFFGTVQQIWGWFLAEEEELPTWAADAFQGIWWFLGQPFKWWKNLTEWLHEHHLTFGIDVIYQRTGAGDTGAAWVKLGCIVVISILITAIWSLLDRRKTGHPVLGRWLHLGARWYVALILFGYGLAKFYGGQFAEPTLGALTREVGDHSPMGLVWTFMGASQPYNYLAGAAEITCFVLLLHRRTTLLGSFVTIAVVSNVAAINWLYGWPVKLYSGHLLLIAVFLLAPYRKRLWALFVTNRTSTPVDLRVTKTAWLGWLLTLVGWAWAIGTVVNSYRGYSAHWQQTLETTRKKPELYGFWKVERMLLDGEQVPPTDSSRWERLIIDLGGRASAKTLLGQVYPFDYTEDLDAGTVTVKPRGGTGAAETWTIERSTVTRKVRHPAPKTLEEMRTPVDGERQAIVFRGKWRGKVLELHTVQKTFRVHDRFRLIRELPR